MNQGINYSGVKYHRNNIPNQEIWKVDWDNGTFELVGTNSINSEHRYCEGKFDVTKGYGFRSMVPMTDKEISQIRLNGAIRDDIAHFRKRRSGN